MSRQNPSLEESTDPEDAAESALRRAEDYTREEPLKAVGLAFTAGLILTLLPVGAILAAIVRLAVTLLRPALLILGAIKLYEEIDHRRNE
ncbi:MAG TPA: hypothetical protein VGH90_05605 [Chthoniobacteraceae bacterium]|jgi:hypothetical protein